ncbi:hypothetical protein AX16_004776 [Volvariella volvacea WC 439]|nr:hypothetical protein AX16_004776 [Volvariella volvacea WC 439]
MKDLDPSGDIIIIIPRHELLTLEFSAYFSITASIKGKALKVDKYKSFRLYATGTRKSPAAPRDFPDYTFIIYVEDVQRASQVADAPKFCDSYELMEGSGRTGGRLYTHHFTESPGAYQYYDVGAMRFPEHTFTEPLFQLARELGLTMLPYIRDQPHAFLSYNISITKAEHNFVKDPHHRVWRTLEEALGELRQNFVKDPFDTAFKKLIAYEKHSVASYLLLEKNIPYLIKWWDTMESRTGLFDRSLVETVLASLIFKGPSEESEPVHWWCFDGGSEVLHKAMAERITTKPRYYMRVTAIKESDDGDTLTVTFDSSHSPRPAPHTKIEKKYSHVISTTSLGCLRMVDLGQLYLSHRQRDDMRQLTYTPSIEIGIQFKTAWWERLSIVGGQSSIDRPACDVVYPSYGPDASHPGSQMSKCLISSYNGLNDLEG